MIPVPPSIVSRMTGFKVVYLHLCDGGVAIWEDERAEATEFHHHAEAIAASNLHGGVPLPSDWMKEPDPAPVDEIVAGIHVPHHPQDGWLARWEKEHET